MSLRKLWLQNKQIIVVSTSIFIISLATILFFTPNNGSSDYLQSNLIGHEVELSDSYIAEDGSINYEVVLDNPENPYFVLDKDGKVLVSKSKYAEGSFLFDFINKDAQEEVFKAYRDVFATHEAKYKAGPFRTTVSEEERIVFLSFIAFVEDSEEIVVEVHDVTEDLEQLRKQLEDKIELEDGSNLVVEKLLFASKNY